MVFKKMNVKKKQQLLKALADKTLLIAFGVSVALHLVVIYTIPAVELFAEGPGGGDPIVVELIAEAAAETDLSIPDATDNQFLATSTEEQPAAPEETAPVSAPEPVETELVASRATASDVEAELPYTMLVDQQAVKDRLRAPTELAQLRSPISSAQSLPDMTPGFKKRAITPIEQDLPMPSAPGEIRISGTKKQLRGLDREDAEDRNRFGMFVGELPETLDMLAKESVQEAMLPRNSGQEAQAPQEKDAVAKTLDVSPQIEGPIRGRAVIYQPPPPKVEDIRNEVELQLKFWVLPDGTIGEVIPTKRGDAILERVAIAYLKRWQFQPLPSSVPQQQVWGTIPIKFTLQ